MKQIKLHVSLLAAALAATGCGGGATGASNATTPVMQTLTANSQLLNAKTASACLSGSLSLADPTNLWYSALTLTIKNNCATSQTFAQSSTVSWKSQDQAGAAVAVNETLGLVPGWSPTLTFSSNGNVATGTLASNLLIPANSSVSYGSGGISVNGSAYNLALANSTLAIGGNAPTQQYGKLNISFNASGICTSSCAPANVTVTNSSNQVVKSFSFTNWNSTTTTQIESLPADQYTVTVANANNYSASATPNPTGVQVNSTATTQVSFKALVSYGDIKVTLPTSASLGLSNLPATIPATLYSGTTLIGTYQLSLTSGTTDLGNLPVLSGSGSYTLVLPNVGDAQVGKYFAGGSVSVTPKANQSTSVSYNYTTSLAAIPFTLSLSGLGTGATANLNFTDALGTVYAPLNSLSNGAKNLKLPAKTLVYPTVAATGYTSNVISGSSYNTANSSSAVISFTVVSSQSTVAGWPAYVAMGAVGGPNTTPPTATSTGGDDDFGGKPVDVVFKYAGVNGDGDPGVIDPPTNAIRMTNDLTALSAINQHPSRVAIVEYTAQMSGGENFSDFTNTTAGASSGQAAASYIMARHFSSLAADAIALAAKPVSYNNQNYYGSLIMNPDLLGAIQQNNYTQSVNNALPAGAVNTAVDQALCLMTTSRTYVNQSNPNGLTNPSYLGKTYTGTPVQILLNLLNDGYPVWSINGMSDPFWNSTMSNPTSMIGTWFDSCVGNPSYNKTQYARPNFPAGFEGWVQANNWLIRTFAKQGTVTFGWQDNMWAVGSGFWLHKDLSATQIASSFATPVSSWLTNNAPSAITSGALGSGYKPDYFLFDRYEMDDSAAPGSATLYNARSWDNYLNAVGQVSRNFNNIPIMLWQIPGSHLPYVGEPNPELLGGNTGSYIFSTAPVYFFGDSNLSSNLSNLIQGLASSTNANTAVGNFALNCGVNAYNCPTGSNYQQYLMQYQGGSNNYDWSKDNAKLALAAQNNVFAILWGGGNTTNVIKNFSNPDDHGWLAKKLINYFGNPQPLVKH